jgi:GH15 family glucan-1,4-alpha-glucosidase
LLQNKALTEASVDVICGLQEENGGILATPKDDAYPYVYPRDATIMTMAFNKLGMYDRSKKFYNFLKGVGSYHGEFFQRYNGGYPYVTQKKEFDVTPIVLQGIHDTYWSSGDKEFLEDMWGLVGEGANFIVSNINSDSGLVHTFNSVHENQSLEEGFEIWANCAAVKGLIDASIMAGDLKHEDSKEAWKTHANSLWGKILEKLYDTEKGLFIKNLKPDGSKITAPDMAQLSPFYFGICSDESILTRTLNHLKETLWNSQIGGFNRFRDFEIVDDWHWYTGGTGGAWPIFTIWAAKLYEKLGMVDSAQECMDFVKRASTEELLIPEKVAPIQGYKNWKSNETEFNERISHAVAKVESNRFRISIPEYVFWALPLGWAHAEYILLEKDWSINQHELVTPDLTEATKTRT